MCTCVSLMGPARRAVGLSRGPQPGRPRRAEASEASEADDPSVCSPWPPRGPFSESVLLPLGASSRTLPAQVNHYPGSVWSARQWAWLGVAWCGVAAATAAMVPRRSFTPGCPLPPSLVLFTCQAVEWNFARGRSVALSANAPRPAAQPARIGLGVNGTRDLNLTLAPRPTSRPSAPLPACGEAVLPFAAANAVAGGRTLV